MKKYCFDLDGVICNNTNGDYVNAQPFLDAVKKSIAFMKKETKLLYLQQDTWVEMIMTYPRHTTKAMS